MALGVGKDVRLAPFHGPGQAHPVQNLVLAGVTNLGRVQVDLAGPKSPTPAITSKQPPLLLSAHFTDTFIVADPLAAAITETLSIPPRLHQSPIKRQLNLTINRTQIEQNNSLLQINFFT